MKKDENHSRIQGRYPECGAIFMSSSSTKDECFRRRLFGLPSKQGTFVKQVKRGMILFLFEFEKRELHGVFQACSDGSMNIVPTAWSRSGKKFPAQVRVEPIWRCHPLPESEFGDAINTNYWSEGKFNFGLSKTQVWRLLMLFNGQKLKHPHPQRALARNTKPVDPKDIDEELDDDSINNNELRSIIRRRYVEKLSGKVEREDATFGNGVNADFEYRAFPSTEQIRSDQYGRGDGNQAMCGRDGSFSHLDRPFYSGMHLQETHSSGVQDRKPSSYQMELPITDYSYAASRGDAITMRNLSYNPDDPGLNLEHSQLVGNLNSVQDFDGQNEIPAVRNEVNPLYAEINGPNQSLEDISKVDVRKSFSDIGPVSSTGMFYCPKASLSPKTFSEFRSDGTDVPSSYPLSPSNYPSFLVDRGYSIATEEKQCQSPCRSHSADLENVDYHKCKCFDHKISNRMLCSDLQESRSSVFSRLSSNTPGWCLENIGHLDHEETVKDASSVDEVMEMLSKTHYPWMESEKSKLRKRGQCYVEKSRNVKQRSSIKSELEMIPEKSITTCPSPTEDKDDQSSENAVFLDFKRRSELQKVYCDTKEERAGSEGLIVGQCKRRKLIRPNFSEKEISHDYPVNSCLKLQASVNESCFVGSQGKLSLQGAESSHDNEKIDTECFSKYENETIEGSSVGFPIIGDDSRKESLHGYPFNSCLNLQAAVDESSFCEDANCKKKLVENVSDNLDVGMMNCQHGSTTERLISCNSKQRESPQQKGSRTNMQEAVKFSDNDASHYNSREREIEDKQESFVDSVKSGDEHGIESVQVVGRVILNALEDSLPTMLSEDFPETDQVTVLESATQPNSGTSTGYSEIEGDRGSEPELLPMVELCPNINASTHADASAVYNQQGVNSEQLQALCNSDNHKSPQEHGSNNNLVESIELGDSEAIDESVRENRRLWEKLTSGLQLLRKEQQRQVADFL